MPTVKRIIVVFVLSLSAVLLAACATTEQFRQMMDSHLGSHIDELRQRYGYNYIERRLPDGQRAYTWTWRKRGVVPGYQSPTIIRTYKSKKGRQVIIVPGTHFPPEVYESACEFTFITDRSGKALSWRAHGNGCAVYRGQGDVLGPAKKP